MSSIDAEKHQKGSIFKEPSAKHSYKRKNIIRPTKKINKLDMDISAFKNQEKLDSQSMESSGIGDGIHLSGSIGL